jgi:hypothetical protein
MRTTRRGNFLKRNARRMLIEITREKGGKVRYKPIRAMRPEQDKRQIRRFPLQL